MKIYVVPGPNETKFQLWKRKVEAKVEEAKDWCVRNKETIIVLAPVVIGGVTTFVKVVGRRANLNKQVPCSNL